MSWFWLNSVLTGLGPFLGECVRWKCSTLPVQIWDLFHLSELQWAWFFMKTKWNVRSFLDVFNFSQQTWTTTTKSCSFVLYGRNPGWMQCSSFVFTGFFTDEFVWKIINSASAKSCELDPIPTTLLYENLDILLPTIMNIINTSLTTGIVPRDLKTAISSNLCWKSHHLTNIFWKTTIPFLTFHFCPKSLKKSFSTIFSPVCKKTSAIPFSQLIVQDTVQRLFCYVL